MLDSWGVLELSIAGSAVADWSLVLNGETLKYNGVFTPNVSEWVRPDGQLYGVKLQYDGEDEWFLADNKGRLLNLVWTYGNDHIRIEPDENGVFNFVDTQSSVPFGATNVNISSQHTDLTYLFNIGGVEYKLVEYGYGGEPWLTPNNVTVF